MAKKLDRTATGWTVVTLPDGRLQGIITLADGSKKRLSPAFKLGTSRARAEETTAHYQEKATAAGAVKPVAVTEVAVKVEAQTWWAEYFKHRNALSLFDVEGVYRKHIVPVCPKHPRDVSVSDCEAIVAALDGKIKAGELSAKSALNVWAVWTGAMKAASGTWGKKDKPKRFKVRDDDPARGVVRPDEGDGAKRLQWLYPYEYQQLMECKRVPIRRRVRYALAVNLFARGGELAALTWANVNLRTGVVSILVSYNQDRDVVKGTKTGNEGIRDIPLDASMRALLSALHKLSGGEGNVCPMPLRHYWADQLRADLKLAGVERPSLYVSPKDQQQMRIRFHDLRSTGLTWLAIQGVDAIKIQRRGGHSDFATTQGYIRMAEVAGVDIGTPFPPLPVGFIDELKEAHGSADRSGEAKSAEGLWVDWDSKIVKQKEWPASPGKSKGEGVGAPRGATGANPADPGELIDGLISLISRARGALRAV
jgi:integrase